MEQKRGLDRIISMARKLRPYIEGAFYHVMARGINGLEIFAQQREQTLFYDSLARIQQAKPFDLLGHCLMNNHFHLVLRILRDSMSEIMHLLLTRFAVIYNKNHDRKGHVFQGRHLPLLISDDAYLMTVLRYVHLNPVAAGLVTYPEQWRLSGHNEILGLAAPRHVKVPLALALFGDDPGAARTRYREFVYAKLLDPDVELPRLETPGDTALPESGVPWEPEIPEGQTLAALCDAVAENARLDPAYLRTGRCRLASGARKKLILAAFQGGHRVADVARFLGISSGYVSKIASSPEK